MTKLDLGNGVELEFGQLVAWDLIAIKRELGKEVGDADPYEGSLAMAWRAAIRGGFDGGFQDFCESIPLDKLAEVSEAAAPFLGVGKSAGEESAN
jgi:hypothetical protein